MLNIFKKKQFEFVEDATGLHQVGGDFPEGFVVPANDFPGSFQYIGFIDNVDSHFSWLPFKLHIIFPTLLYLDRVFLDYKNPMKPELFHLYREADIESPFDEVTVDSFVVYESQKLALKPFSGVNDDNEFEVLGVTGEPHYTQDKFIPKCPQTGKSMKFVCQFFSNQTVKAKEKNFSSTKDYYESLFNQLSFFSGDGDLMVYIQPSSKTACFIVSGS